MSAMRSSSRLKLTALSLRHRSKTFAGLQLNDRAICNRNSVYLESSHSNDVDVDPISEHQPGEIPILELIAAMHCYLRMDVNRGQ